MVEAVHETESVQVAVCKTAALIRVTGRGTYRMGPSLDRFSEAALGRGCRLFILDLHRCVGMDSTFIGLLAGLALRMNREGTGELVMLNLGDKVVSLIETLGLSRVFRLYMGDEAGGAPASGPAGVARMAPLDAGSEDRRAIIETMLSAHCALVEASPENLPKFKDVIEYLKTDLDQDGPT